MESIPQYFWQTDTEVKRYVPVTINFAMKLKNRIFVIVVSDDPCMKIMNKIFNNGPIVRTDTFYYSMN